MLQRYYKLEEVAKINAKSPIERYSTGLFYVANLPSLETIS
jgi:hypothetical protein